jgi:hypothetical protein
VSTFRERLQESIKDLVTDYKNMVCRGAPLCAQNWLKQSTRCNKTVQLEISVTTQTLIEKIAVKSYSNPRMQEVASAALQRAAQFFGDLHASTANLWDVRDSKNNYMMGKFTYNTAAGLLPGTTLEQHGALEYHARNILGALDDQYVVDNLNQVLNGRPISLMGYISGGTSGKGQIALQINPDLLYQAVPESDRLYWAVIDCAYSLIQMGVDPQKPVAFHAEMNNRYGVSQIRKAEYDLLKSINVAEAELPRYRAHIYLTMPETLALNEDLLAEDLVLYNLAYWAKS